MAESPDPNRVIRCDMQPGFFDWMRKHPVSAVAPISDGVIGGMLSFHMRTIMLR